MVASLLIQLPSRAILVAGLLGLFGTMVFRLTVAPLCWREMTPAREAATRRRLARLSVACLWIVIAGGGLLTATDAGSLVGRHGPLGWIAAFLFTLWRTDSGRRTLAQIGLAIAAIIALGNGGRIAQRLSGVFLAAGALGLEADRDGGVPGPVVPFELLHLWAAGTWVGMLPSFGLMFRAEPAAFASAARRAAAIGRWAILVVVGSAVIEAPIVAGGLAGLLGTGFGHVLLVKGSLLAILAAISLVFAARLLPALANAAAGKTGTGRAGRRVRLALDWQLWLSGVLLLLSVGAALASRTALTEPLWPFPVLPSLDAALGDPPARSALLRSLALAALSLLAVAAAVQWRRHRAVAVGVALLAGIVSLPGFGGLLVEAHPTSYFRSPTGFSAASIANGLRLHAEFCADCHGAAGRGDGAQAASLLSPPRDYRRAALSDLPDGALYWTIAHGIDHPSVMPGFAQRLGDADIWALIDAVRLMGTAQKLPAPTFTAECAGRGRVAPRDWAGSPVDILLPMTDRAAPVDAGNAAVIVLPAAGSPPPSSGCFASDPTPRQVYDALAGGAGRVRIDPEGFVVR